jgi:hypothetical protein
MASAVAGSSSAAAASSSSLDSYRPESVNTYGTGDDVPLRPNTTTLTQLSAVGIMAKYGIAPGTLRLHFLCFFFGIGASIWG